MCESDNKIIVLNRAGWINKDRILFYNYELQYKDNAPEKFCTREEMCKKYKLTRGSIHQLINDGKKGKDPSKRYKWKDFQIKAIHESRGCIIEESCSRDGKNSATYSGAQGGQSAEIDD